MFWVSDWKKVFSIRNAFGLILKYWIVYFFHSCIFWPSIIPFGIYLPHLTIKFSTTSDMAVAYSPGDNVEPVIKII